MNAETDDDAEPTTHGRSKHYSSLPPEMATIVPIDSEESSSGIEDVYVSTVVAPL
jgi:hypothetical protein